MQCSRRSRFKPVLFGEFKDAAAIEIWESDAEHKHLLNKNKQINFRKCCLLFGILALISNFKLLQCNALAANFEILITGVNFKMASAINAVALICSRNYIYI